MAEEGPQLGGGHHVFVLAKGGTHFNAARPHWRKGVAPWAGPVAGLDDTTAFAGGPARRRGPNAAFAVACPMAGGQTYPLMEPYTLRLKTLPVPAQSPKDTLKR